MTTVLVTGGNIGDLVAKELAEQSLAVRVMTKGVKLNQKLAALGIEQIAVEMADVRSMIPAFEGVERFFSVTPFVENLAELGINSIEAAKHAGVRRIVRSSFIGASGTGLTLGRDHHAVETAVMASGIPYTILRPNTFMQSYGMNTESIKNNSAFYMPQGDGRVSLVDVRDVASTAAAVLVQAGHDGQTYDITGGETLSNAEVAEKLSLALGRHITYVDVSEIQAEQSMTNAGLPAWMVKSLLELFQYSKRGDAAATSPVVETILRRKPLSFDKFLRDNISSFS